MYDYYTWVTAFHIVSVISWMAGLFYLPRLYVYHAKHQAGSEASETFKVMERKLLRIIMNPAMIASLASGLILVWLGFLGSLAAEGWLHAKLALSAGMIWYHMLLARWRIAFARDANTRSEKFYRMVNEVPTLLMIGIVVLVVVKPF